MLFFFSFAPPPFSHQVATPGKRLTWQGAPDDSNKVTAATPSRKREWGEVATSSASAPSPLEAVHSSPVSCSWAERGQRWGTPRASEASPWGVGGRGGRGSSSASNVARRGKHPWRRASGDFGQSALAAARGPDFARSSSEDSLGYSLLACDGRECKVCVVIACAAYCDRSRVAVICCGCFNVRHT